MVEVTESRTRHRFACAHPVSEGMIVKVNTPKVVQYRKSVMEYLLAHHELSCPTCDKAGECGLQDITHELNQAPSRFRVVRMNAPIIRDNPVLELNRNRCILCGRCVSTCREIEGIGVIDFQKRGINTYIGTAFDKPLGCSFCGGCLAVCPTGSWQDRSFAFRGRPWELKKTQTICPYCAVGCTIVVNTKSVPMLLDGGQETVRRVTSDDHLGVNEGNLCIKGRFGHEFIHAEGRIKTPFIRKDGELLPATWPEAIRYASEKFRQVINGHGGKAIAGIGSEKATNEDNYLFQKFCRSVLGTNTIDNLANMKSPSLNSLIYKSVAYGLAALSLQEVETANTLFFFGADVTEAHPVIGNMARKAIRMNDAHLIIANMRDIVFRSTAKKSIRLHYTAGSQIALVNALIKVILDKKLVDLSKVESGTNNFRELLSFLDDYNVKKASQLTGVSKETIRDTAIALAKPGRCIIVCGKDIQEDPLASDTIEALMNLCTLVNTAYYTDTNSCRISLLFSRSHNNSQGINDMGVVPEFLPGYVDIHDVPGRERVEKLWGITFPSDFFENKSVPVLDLILQGKVKGLYVMGTNPAVECIPARELRKALKKIDFLVVQDAFLTETAQFADVVFPASTFAEKEGTFTNMGMTVQRLNKVLLPIGDSKPDWQIICELAREMGNNYPYASAKDILNEIERIVPMYTGINYDRLKRKEFYWASSVFDKNKQMKYTFRCIPPKVSGIKKNTGFPFLLYAGASLNHQGTFSRYSKTLVSVAPECFVEINRKDASGMDIQNGDMVCVESTHDSIKLKAKITSRLPAGMVFLSEDYEWVPINLLRTGTYTPVRVYKER